MSLESVRGFVVALAPNMSNCTTPSDWVGDSNASKVAQAVSNGLLSENCTTASDWVRDSSVSRVSQAMSNGLLSEICTTASDWVGDSNVFVRVAHSVEAMP